MPKLSDVTGSKRKLSQVTGADFGDVRGASDTVPMQPNGAGTLARDVPMGLRSTLEGVAAIPDFFGGPIRYALEKTVGPQMTFGQMATGLSDAMHLPKPETPRERIVSDVGRAVSGTAATMGAGGALPVASRARAFLTANPTLQGVSATTGALAGGITRENGGTGGEQLLATLVGGLGPAAFATLPAAAVRFIARGGEAGRLLMQAAIDDFKAVGTTPTVGQATQRPFWRGVESLLAKLPGGSGVMERKAAQQGQEIGAGVSRLAGQLAPRVDPTSAGRAIERGINGPGPDSFIARTRATQDRLYGALDQQIPANQRVGVGNTSAALDAINPTIPGAPNLSQFFQNARIKGIQGALGADSSGVPALLTRPGTQEWADAMRQSLTEEAARIEQQNVFRTSLGQKPLPVPSAADIDEHIAGRLAGMVDDRLPYEALRKVRTLVGQEIADAGIGADVPRSKWNPLYGAMSEDLRAAAAETGPEATAAFGRANRYTRAMEGRKEAIAHVVDKSGGPEAIFTAAVSGTREGATTLRALMRSLPESSQRQVAAAVLQRMGRAINSQQNAASDVFSSGTFLTNWNKLSAEARGVLFDRFGPEFRAQVDAITRTAGNLKEGSKVFANPSGTATTGAQIGGYTALGSTGVAALLGHPLPFLGTAGGLTFNNLAARGMTNPGFVQWLARPTDMPVGVLAPQGALLQLLQQNGQPGQDGRR